MDLKKQPLYALRDLAVRLDIKAPTACTKTELIAKIEERKIEIEENRASPNFKNRGRPRKNTYIGVKIDKDGKLDLFEARQPLLYDDFSSEISKLINPQAATPYPPVIEDEESREKLKKAQDILSLLSFAIITVLER